MLPNVCFPLFPVVDFKTFRRTYYDDDAYRDLPDGHRLDRPRRSSTCILYRFIYYHLTLAPSEVTGPAQFLQYLVANFLLYLRVSGQFHLIVGMLHLFGFDLPETHHRYLLASSFTDFWRRINIYWKDFMQKVFYFPAVFALKRLGTTQRDRHRDAVRLPADLVPALVPVVLAARHAALRVAGHAVLGHSRRAGRGQLALRDQVRPQAPPRRKRCGRWRSGAVTIAEDLRDVLVHLRPLVVLDRASRSPTGSSLWSALKGQYTLDALLFPVLVPGGHRPRQHHAAGVARRQARPTRRRAALDRERAVTVAVARWRC